MPERLSTACELVGLAAIAVAVGFLADVWWGVLTVGVLLVVVGIAGGLARGERSQ